MQYQTDSHSWKQSLNHSINSVPHKHVSVCLKIRVYTYLLLIEGPFPSREQRVVCEQIYRVLSSAGEWTANTSMERKAWRCLLVQNICTSAYTFLLLLMFVLPLCPQASCYHNFLRTSSSTEHDI